MDKFNMLCEIRYRVYQIITYILLDRKEAFVCSNKAALAIDNILKSAQSAVHNPIDFYKSTLDLMLGFKIINFF